MTNLAYSCQGCNNRKFTSVEALDPLTREGVPLYHPRQHQWSDHFIWDADFALILGITPIGRATIAKLQLNRRGVVNLRRALRQLEKHPMPEI